MKACVVYDSRYGNTEQVAASLEAGLKRAGVETTCKNVKEVKEDALAACDLICVGAPTEWLTASKPMRTFLETLRGHTLSGKRGFAFDTKLARPLSGSAAKLIEKELRARGIQLIAPHESATVFLENGSTSGAWLKEGEKARFEGVGQRIGAALASGDTCAVA